MEPQSVVGRGYDDIGDRYLRGLARDPSSPRLRYLDKLLTLLPADGRMLELGCGSATRSPRRCQRGARLVAVDLSGVQLALARRNAPAAALLRVDMSRLRLLPASFDAVGAFYSLTHVAREHLGIILGLVAEWLRPGGIFVATMGRRGLTGVRGRGLDVGCRCSSVTSTSTPTFGSSRTRDSASRRGRRAGGRARRSRGRIPVGSGAQVDDVRIGTRGGRRSPLWGRSSGLDG
jgi:SAM-dependent methyltransferase